MHTSKLTFVALIVIGAALDESQPGNECEAEGTCHREDEGGGADSSILLQTTASKAAGGDVCPSDVPAEALGFWKDFFKTKCKVEWDPDVPQSFKDDITNSVSFHPQKSDGVASAGCRIETSLSDVGGRISFNILPPAADGATDEGWSGLFHSAIRQMNVGGKISEKAGKGVCGIFGDGVPRMVDIDGAKVTEVFEQIKEDYARECQLSGGAGQLTLATDTSVSPVVGKRSMSDSSGKPIYTFVLSVAAPGKDDVDVEVWAAEDQAYDSDSTITAANKEFEREVKKEAEEADSKADIKSGGTGLVDYGDVDDNDEVAYANPVDKEDVDVASYIQGRVRLHGVNDDTSRASDADNIEEAKVSPEGFIDVEDEGGSAADSEPAAVLGKLRVLEDRTTPLLCCLCGKCAKPEACTLGAEGLAPSPSFIEEDDLEAKLREQERLYPDLAPNLLLQVGTASHGSKEENHPPLSPGDVMTPADYRIRAEPGDDGYGYGDNYHSLVLPQRTASDHKEVWARSRALIEAVKAEGITIPDSYNFYDSPVTANCFQPAYNQGKCGSCWAFASLGALEKQICLRAKGDVKASLSREMLVRCSEQNNGCQGGNADKAYEDLMEIGGVFSTDCLPYQGKGSKHCPVFAYSWFGQGSAGKTGKFARIDQEMQKSCGDHTRYSNRPPQGHEWDMPFRMMYEARFGKDPNMNDQRLQRYRRNFAKTRARDRVPSWWLYGQEAMKSAVVKYGSVYASFKVRNDFKGRKCGDGCWPPGTVYGEEAGFKPAACGCGKGHAVHIIGFGEDIQETGTKVPFWLIENSWGDQTHGDVFGEDSEGVKGFGKDPFTEEHPMGVEDKCVLAGWAYSTLPRTGGCGGNANIDLRKDVKMKCGERQCKPDGMYLSVMVDGVGKGNWSVPEDSSKKFSLTLGLTPGKHDVKFMIYAKDHPKQQSFDVESYGITATSLRCRGRGYRYSFTQNDTKANLSWGRKTRQQLKAEADALIPTRTDPKYLYAGCPEPCRTGRYSWVKPCLGLLATWGSCYTDDWAKRSSYILSRKKADCEPCDGMKVKLAQKAYAVKNLPNATFAKWFNLVEESWTAPDDPGWMRQNTGTCVLKTGGWVTNALLSATYPIDMPGNTFCDERHSAPYAQGKFVHAPGYMRSGEKKFQRCPPPMAGNVSLQCRAGVLYALSNDCQIRPGTPANLATKRGYYKMLRGSNYHGIESGAAFAIAEMNRFASHCPTLSWSRWSECNVTTPCARGVQTRSREPIGLSKSDPKCANIMFSDERTCVGPGFCPQVLTRFATSAGVAIDGFLASYKRQSTTIKDGQYATAGAHMMSTSTPTCSDAKYWCKITTGRDTCDMYMEGHFKVEKTAEYYLHYETEGGFGQLEFNTLGEGSETKPQYLIRGAGGSSSSMFEWQDLGFHHRRRRSGSKPWERVSSIKLSKGTYYARLTRGSWSSCPTYKLRLEQLSAVYRDPLLLGALSANKTAAALNKGGTQKTTTWWNNWGAIRSYYKNYRERGYGGYAPKKESGSMNELVLRNEPGGKVIKKVPITKMNFTADELYTMVGLNRHNLPTSIRRYARYELVLRNTVILPEKGDYIFKVNVDTSFNTKDQGWQQPNRRRQTNFAMRVGTKVRDGRGYSQATFTAYQGSGTKSVSYQASAAGTVPFEVSIGTWYNAPGDKMTLPNSVQMIMKRKDMLHGDSLAIGSQTKYMSDLVAIRGDTKVRIDWPERDDPLSSELKTQTFEALDPQALLIGNKEVAGGFQALAEAKIDAGACTSIEAWAAGVASSAPFLGVGLNLCDVDGDNQFLELVTYHPAKAELRNLTNMTKTRVGWVHIGFTQPTHMMITRDPLDLKKFTFGYRPDNRQNFATPFAPLVTQFTGKMDVGVSMNSPEAYRYAEFYNVSIEECPSTCNDAAGKQLWCGDFVTPCGNKVKCGAQCSNGDVCNDNMCMKCPALNLSAVEQQWECGQIRQHCLNHKQQKVQVIRDVGTRAQPSSLHFCKANKWTCVGKSKWAFLADGLECGNVEDNCKNNVTLFPCPMKNDRCMSHKCKCFPTNFPVDYECGSDADGCGKNIMFGKNNGKCPGSTDRCNAHKCCTPKTKASFPKTYQCGQEQDGCGGTVDLSQAPATAFINVKPTRTTGWYYTGQIGIEFIAKSNVKVSALARGMMEGKSTLATKTQVSLYDVESKSLLASADIGLDAAYTTKNGYAWVKLASPVEIKAGKKYRLMQRVWRSIKDRYAQVYMSSNAFINAHKGNIAQLRGQVFDGKTSGYPTSSSVRYGLGAGIVNFDVLENDGCGAGLWTCHTNHSCTKTVLKGFQVKSGSCKTDGNSCVTSPNFPSNYGNSQTCQIMTPSEGTMKPTYFNTESGYDYITMDGKRYQGSTGPTQKLTSTKTFSWRSDGSVTRKGWKICVGSAASSLEESDTRDGQEDMVGDQEHDGQQEEENEQEGIAEDVSEELDESEIAKLPEEEREHAVAKYQEAAVEAAEEAKAKQDFEESVAAEAAEAAAATEGVSDEEQAPEESDEDEVAKVELTEDEAALPDLTLIDQTETSDEKPAEN